MTTVHVDATLASIIALAEASLEDEHEDRQFILEDVLAQLKDLRSVMAGSQQEGGPDRTP